MLWIITTQNPVWNEEIRWTTKSDELTNLKYHELSVVTRGLNPIHF